MSVLPFSLCPVSGCAHGGVPVALRACVTFLVEEITEVLAHPGLPAYSVGALNRVDAAFSCLDALLRAGAQPPAVWKVTSQVAPGVQEEVTELYDAVSEALRETGDVIVCRQALRTAAAEWKRLHEALCTGAPLPEPWQCH